MGVKHMFKQIVVSIVLSVSLLSSIALWAQGSNQPAVVAKLEVTHQLSISEHEQNEAKFIQQVAEEKHILSLMQTKNGVPMPILSALGIMVFGLMYFVLRSSRQRIK